MISFFGFDLMANKAPKRKYIYFSLAPNQKRANEGEREREISDWWYHRWFRRFRNEKGKTNGNDAQREMRRHITSFRGTFLANTKVRSLELHYRHFVDKQTTFGIVMKWREREKKKPKLILNRDYSFSLICKCKDSHIFEIKLKKTFHCRRRHNEQRRQRSRLFRRQLHFICGINFVSEYINVTTTVRIEIIHFVCCHLSRRAFIANIGDYKSVEISSEIQCDLSANWTESKASSIHKHASERASERKRKRIKCNLKMALSLVDSNLVFWTPEPIYHLPISYRHFIITFSWEKKSLLFPSTKTKMQWIRFTWFWVGFFFLFRISSRIRSILSDQRKSNRKRLVNHNGNQLQFKIISSFFFCLSLFLFHAFFRLLESATECNHTKCIDVVSSRQRCVHTHT